MTDPHKPHSPSPVWGQTHTQPAPNPNPTLGKRPESDSEPSQAPSRDIGRTSNHRTLTPHLSNKQERMTKQQRGRACTAASARQHVGSVTRGANEGQANVEAQAHVNLVIASASRAHASVRTKARELSMPIPHPRLDQRTHQHPSHPFALILTWSMRVVFTLSVGGVTVGDGDGGGDSIMSNLQGGQEL